MFVVMLTLQLISGVTALPSVPGLPPNISWGMSPAQIMSSSNGSIQAPVPNSVEALVPPRGLRLGAQARQGGYTTSFYFSPMSVRLSAVLVSLEDGTKEASKCLPWLYELRALLGEPVATSTTRPVSATFITATTTVTFVSTYRKKRAACSILMESSQPLPPQ